MLVRKLELTAVLGRPRVDACRSQAFQMVVMLSWIYDVDALSPHSTRLDEWKQHTVLFVFAIEKRTNVTYVASWEPARQIGATVFFNGVYLALFSPDYGLPARRDDPPLVLQAAAAMVPSLDSPHQ